MMICIMMASLKGLTDEYCRQVGKNVSLDNLGIIPEKFRQLGIELEFIGDDIHVPAQDIYEIQTFLDGSVLTIYDNPWPGFTPDLARQSGNITVSITTWDRVDRGSALETEVNTFDADTEMVDFRVNGRAASLRLDCTELGGDFRLGIPKLEIVPRGNRR